MEQELPAFPYESELCCYFLPPSPAPLTNIQSHPKDCLLTTHTFILHAHHTRFDPEKRTQVSENPISRSGISLAAAAVFLPCHHPCSPPRPRGLAREPVENLSEPPAMIGALAQQLPALGGAAAAACVGGLRRALQLQATRGMLWSVEREKVRVGSSMDWMMQPSTLHDFHACKARAPSPRCTRCMARPRAMQHTRLLAGEHEA